MERRTSLSEARALLDIAVTRIPQLTSFGVGLYRDYDCLAIDAWSREMQKQQAELYSESALRMIAFSADWLQNNQDQFRAYLHSYHFKHVVEKWRRAKGDPNPYTHNGAFIAAAVGLGLKWRIDGPNVVLRRERTGVSRGE